MKEIYAILNELLEQGQSAVLATIVKQGGSSPRGVGTKCLIKDGALLAGTVGGGLLEANAVREAGKVLVTGLPIVQSFSTDLPNTPDPGMICGGVVELFLEPVTPQQSGRTRLIRKILGTLAAGETGLLLTLMDERWWNSKSMPEMFIRKNGERIGSFPKISHFPDALIPDPGKIIRSKKPALFSLKDDEGKSVTLFAEPLAPGTNLHVFGAGHVSRKVVPLANTVGFRVTVMDDREGFADGIHFPAAMRTATLPFEGVMDRLSVSGHDFLLIVTRGHQQDELVLGQALKTRAAYIGMIGSRRKRETIYKHLLEQGFTEKDLARVHSPVGLSIGAETPEEIAVSIVAELIQVRSQLG
jgi:xanthine dehydrogenase accessory factor